MFSIIILFLIYFWVLKVNITYLSSYFNNYIVSLLFIISMDCVTTWNLFIINYEWLTPKGPKIFWTIMHKNKKNIMIITFCFILTLKKCTYLNFILYYTYYNYLSSYKRVSVFNVFWNISSEKYCRVT